MTTSSRAWTGAFRGVLFASAAFVVGTCFTDHLGWGWGVVVVTALFIVPFMLVLAGPGALLLGWMHSSLLERYARRATTLGAIRRVGILLGMPLGVANLVLTIGFFASIGNGIHNITAAEEVLTFLASALAGGVGLGWGCTSGLKPGRSGPRAPLRRAAPPIPRREGPPFFDNRPGRELRRAP